VIVLVVLTGGCFMASAFFFGYAVAIRRHRKYFEAKERELEARGETKP